MQLWYFSMVLIELKHYVNISIAVRILQMKLNN